MTEITKDTRIHRGMMLSKNFNLAHLSSGAYHPMMAEWIPRFTSTIIPNTTLRYGLQTGQGTPLWQLVGNLQLGAQNLLEDLLWAFGGDLIVKAGYANNVPKNGLANEVQHMMGTSFDIQIKGNSDNMYNVAKEVQKVTKRASELNLVYGNDSWVHIGFDRKRASTPALLLDPVEFTTSDIMTGVTEKGITSLRGFI